MDAITALINRTRAALDMAMRQYRNAITRNHQDRAWDHEVGLYYGGIQARAQTLIDLGVSMNDGVFAEINELPRYERTDGRNSK